MRQPRTWIEQHRDAAAAVLTVGTRVAGRGTFIVPPALAEKLRKELASPAKDRRTIRDVLPSGDLATKVAATFIKRAAVGLRYFPLAGQETNVPSVRRLPVQPVAWTIFYETTEDWRIVAPLVVHEEEQHHDRTLFEPKADLPDDFEDSLQQMVRREIDWRVAKEKRMDVAQAGGGRKGLLAYAQGVTTGVRKIVAILPERGDDVEELVIEAIALGHFVGDW